MPNLSDYMEFKRGKLDELRNQLRDSDSPPAALRATCRVAGGSGIRPVQVRQFSFVTDSGPGLAGYDLGPTAPEVLLSALASCIAHTFLIVGADRGVAYDALEVEVQGLIDFRGVLEVAPDIAPMPTDIHYEARISSDLSAATLEEIRADVERLCPVLQAFVRPLQVDGKVII